MIGTDLEYGDRVEVVYGTNKGRRGVIIGIMLNTENTSAAILDDTGNVFNSFSKYIKTLKDNG